MPDKLPTDLFISAQVRIASAQGVGMYIRHRGDSVSGVILLKINLLNGTSRVFTQIRLDEDLVWTPASKADPMPDEDAERYLSSQQAMDPDVWIVEVEDKLGRPWFPGKIVAL